MPYAFPCSGTVGHKFRRALASDPEMDKAYKLLVGHEAKAKFRAQWAEVRLDAERKARKVKEHSQEDSLTGQYVPFKVLWDREGSDLSGYKAPMGH
jgi:hypothetical protein